MSERPRQRGPVGPETVAAMRALDGDELSSALARVQYSTVSLCNEALIESLKASPWLGGVTAASAFATGLLIGGPAPPEVERLVACASLIVLAALCFAGARWHRRRSLALFDHAQALEPARDALIDELDRRGGGMNG